MTNLSWFLYLADILSNLADVFAIGAAFLICGGLLYALFTSMINDEKGDRRSYKGAIASVIAGVVLIGLTIPIPSKQTLYTIAAVEVGNVVVNSAEGKEVLDEVRKRILSELKGNRQ